MKGQEHMPNTNLNDTNNETALTLTGNVIGQNLTAEKFNALDDLIQKLGDRSTELQPEEKTAAIEVVEDWTKSVTSRIQENATRAANMLHFLSGRTIGGAFLTEKCSMRSSATRPNISTTWQPLKNWKCWSRTGPSPSPSVLP